MVPVILSRLTSWLAEAARVQSRPISALLSVLSFPLWQHDYLPISDNSVGHECETVMKEFDVLLPLFLFPLFFRNKSIPVRIIWGNFSYLGSLRYLVLLP